MVLGLGYFFLMVWIACSAAAEWGHDDFTRLLAGGGVFVVMAFIGSKFGLLGR